jgi:hypothetical protein
VSAVGLFKYFAVRKDLFRRLFSGSAARSRRLLY